MGILHANNILLDDANIAYKPPAYYRKRAGLFKNGNVTNVRGYYHVLIGFVLGFLMAFATLLLYHRQLLLYERNELRTTSNDYYYQSGYITTAPQSSSFSGFNGVRSDFLQQQLEREVRVFCMVLTCPKYHQKRAAHVRATWGRRCNKMIFVSSVTDETLDTVAVIEPEADIYYYLWNKTREGFRYVYEHYFDEYDWFLKADDDTYVVMENLRYMLYGYHTETPIYFGYQMERNNLTYMSGGASYVLSKEALRRFMVDSFQNETICPQTQKFEAEDFNLGICMKNVSVYPVDARFAIPSDENKPKFMPISLQAFMEPEWNDTIPDWLIEMSHYPLEMGVNCCSNYSIAFHYTEPSSMYLYDYLIYHLRIFGLQQPHEELPAKASLQEIEKRFNMSFSN